MNLEDKKDASRISLIDEKETAILVTTNWIPSLPSISMIQTVFESFSYLRGLPPSAPIYITIDALPFINPKKVTPEIIQQHQQKQIQLEEYSFNLMKYFFNHENFTNVRIISNKEHLHIGGNLNKTLGILSPETKYLYSFQHDFKFNKDVNHTLLVSAMKEYPDILKNVRFEKHPYIDRRTPADKCWNSTGFVFQYQGRNFSKTASWSDNNHFASVEYYKKLMKKLISVRRPMEAPMMHDGFNQGKCSEWAQHVYGGPREGAAYIIHLDGRLSYGIENKDT